MSSKFNQLLSVQLFRMKLVRQRRNVVTLIETMMIILSNEPHRLSTQNYESQDVEMNQRAHQSISSAPNPIDLNISVDLCSTSLLNPLRANFSLRN